MHRNSPSSTFGFLGFEQDRNVGQKVLREDSVQSCFFARLRELEFVGQVLPVLLGETDDLPDALALLKVFAVEARAVEIPINRAGRVFAQRLYSQTVGFEAAGDRLNVSRVKTKITQIIQNNHFGVQRQTVEVGVGVERVLNSVFLWGV